MPQMGPLMWLVIILFSWLLFMVISVKSSSLSAPSKPLKTNLNSLTWKW